jgi:hypothetical protein
MVSKKRGLFVVLVVVMAIFSGAYALAEELTPDQSTISITKYDSINIERGGPSSVHDACVPERDCSGDCDQRSFPPEEGCPFYSLDPETGDDGCSHTTFPAGFNIDERKISNKERINELIEAFSWAGKRYYRMDVYRNFFGGRSSFNGRYIWHGLWYTRCKRNTFRVWNRGHSCRSNRFGWFSNLFFHRQ